ncbi:MAG: hypothetical protein AAFR59_17315, partial [Bacteroidota bacterium]
VASWVGLGWSLNAGGVITRMINGTPDEGGFLNEFQNNARAATESRSGWLTTYGMHPALLECSSYPQMTPDGSIFNPCEQNNLRDVPSCIEWMFDANNGFLDSEPDMFNYNFGGYMGKFIFQNGRPVVLGSDKLKIDFASDLSGFTITTPDGVKYFFGGDGATEETFFCNNGQMPSDWNKRSTSYYLKRVESMNGGHYIEFLYETERFNTTSVLGHTRAVNCSASLNPSAQIGVDVCEEKTGESFIPSVPGNNNTIGKRLTHILTSSGKISVNFVANHVRQDLLTFGLYAGVANTESKALDEIIIKEGSRERTFVLKKSYFISRTSGFGFNYPDEAKRLKLDEVYEKGGAETRNTYVFEYNESDALPRRNSLARDHWGYYNGNDAARGLIPSGTR